MDSFFIFTLGLIGGTLVTLGAELLRDWYRRPKLRILEDRPEESSAFSCHAIVVTNDGRSAARNCTGMLSIDDLEKEDVLGEPDVLTLAEAGLSLAKFDVVGPETFLMKAENFRSITNELVAWSRIGNPVEISLHSQTYAMLDVCRYMKMPRLQYHIPSERGWKAVRAALRPRSYHMTLTVVAENARPVSRSFLMQALPTRLRIEAEG